MWLRLPLLLLATSAPLSLAATKAVPLSRTLQQEPNTTTATEQQQVVVTYEFRLFVKPAADELSIQSALTLVRDAFDDHITSLANDSYGSVVTLDSLETRAGSACTDETFTWNAFAQCVHAKSVIVLDVVVAGEFLALGNNLEKAALVQVQDYVPIFNAQHDSIQMIYDYPISVESSIVFTLESANRRMDETELDLFLKNFRIGFEPIMSAGAYEWSEANVVLQLLGRSDRGERRFLQQDNDTANNNNVTEWDPDPNEYNKVTVLLRAICAGETCQSDNFHNFVMQNTVGFLGDFLLLLQMVDVPQAVLYFARISALYVDDSDIVAPLDPDKQARIVEAGEENIPSWVWILLAICVFILLCAIGWVRYRIHRRRSARKGVSAPVLSNDENGGQLQNPQDDVFEEQESFPYFVEGDSNEANYNQGYGQNDEDYSEISGGVRPDEANA